MADARLLVRTQFNPLCGGEKHIGLYPGHKATTVFAEKLAGYKTSKGSIQLPNNKPLPIELIAEIARWCGMENTR